MGSARICCLAWRRASADGVACRLAQRQAVANMHGNPYIFDCYEVLGVSPVATPDEIKSAYRKASLKAHPDVGGSNAAQAKVNAAYEILADPVERSKHDGYWQAIRAQTGRQTRQNAQGASRGSSQQHRAAGSLSALKERLERSVRTARERIWSTLSAKRQAKLEDLERQLAGARSALFWALGIGTIALFLAPSLPILWIAVAWAGFASLLSLAGAEIGGRKFPLFGTQPQQIVDYAEGLARKQCEIEAAALDRRGAELAQVIEVLRRPSSRHDDEIHVARRISVALFVMGYTPILYDSDNRMMVFADGETKLVARFRHRDGPSLNVTYVEKLHMFARAYGAKHALLFCSPGLSGNAAAYASEHGIRPYTLERMNAWMDDVSRSNYCGPQGEILELVQRLTEFLGGVSPPVSRSYYRPTRRRYRRYR